MAASVHGGYSHRHHQQEVAKNPSSGQEPVICRFWVQGRCTRSPCRFAHSFSADHQQPPSSSSSSSAARCSSLKPCSFFLRDSPCPKGEQTCKFLHAHSEGSSTLLTQLDGHGKGCAVTGIVLPQGTNTLYTGGRDRKVKVWDCDSGRCLQDIPLDGEIGCMLSNSSDPDWLFVGIPDEVKVWNLKTQTEQKLCAAPAGQVRALAAAGDMLLAGTDSGKILVWRFNSASFSFEPAASFSCGAQSGPVRTLEPYLAADKRLLFSGSADGSIRVWDLATSQCLLTLPCGHAGPVTGILSWNQFLVSASLDGTLKIWDFLQEEGVAQLDLRYTHPSPTTGRASEAPELLSFCGFIDENSTPVLLCSYAGDNNHAVRVYDLPSFTERAVLFSSDPVQSLETGPTGLAFSGDRAGRLKVWRLAASC